MKEADKITPRLRALISPETINDDTFEVVFATETPVLRYDWRNDTYYYEVLSCKPEHVKSDRLEAGLPLFDNHPYNYSALTQLGKSTEIRFENSSIVAVMKWGKRADQELKDDVKDGIISGISCGYNLYEYEQFQNVGEDYPTRKFTSWEVMEISLAPVMADPKSKVRCDEPICINPKNENLIDSLTNLF